MRHSGWMTVPLACAMLALAGCGSKDEAEPAATASDEAAIGEAAGASDVAASPVPDAATPAAAGSATPTDAPVAKAGGAGDLTAYIGKYPFDAVNGVKWDDHPAVKAVIQKTVTDAAVRDAILNVSGPASPIELWQGKIAAWACQAHNCGDHQWNVMLDPKTSVGQVCYHDEAKTPGQSRWFLPGGKVETRPGNCSSEG